MPATPIAAATSSNVPLVLAIEAVRLAFLVRGEQIEIAIAIEVPPHGADGLARIADARRLRHVDEPAAIVSQQSIRHVAEGRKQIEVAVPVVVDPRRLARHAVQVDADRPSRRRRTSCPSRRCGRPSPESSDRRSRCRDRDRRRRRNHPTPRRASPAATSSDRRGRPPPRRRETCPCRCDRSDSAGRGTRRSNRGRRRCRHRPTRWPGRRRRRTDRAGPARTTDARWLEEPAARDRSETYTRRGSRGSMRFQGFQRQRSTAVPRFANTWHRSRTMPLERLEHVRTLWNLAVMTFCCWHRRRTRRAALPDRDRRGRQ